MSKEYIERGALKEDLKESYDRLRAIYDSLTYDEDKQICAGQLTTFTEAILRVKNAPAADVAEVRHGRWICINKRYGEYECSVCHGMDSNCSDYYGIHAVTEQEFCPNCGAKMDKEK